MEKQSWNAIESRRGHLGDKTSYLLVLYYGTVRTSLYHLTHKGVHSAGVISDGIANVRSKPDEAITGIHLGCAKYLADEQDDHHGLRGHKSLCSSGAAGKVRKREVQQIHHGPTPRYNTNIIQASLKL